MGTLAVVELPMRSGLAKDKAVNTFAIAESGSAKGTGLYDADYIAALAELYTVDMPGASEALGEYIGPQVSRVANACAIKLYDITDHLDGSPHGSPRTVATFTMPAAQFAASPGLPEECAIAVTMEALNRSTQFVETPDGTDPGAAPDRPRQRYTGRVYLGPLVATETGFRTQDANGMVRPNAAVLTAIRAAFVRCADAIDVASGDLAALGVWSRANRAIRGAEYFRTDDAFDTQRRRGASPTTISRTRVGDLVPEIELGA